MKTPTELIDAAIKGLVSPDKFTNVFSAIKPLMNAAMKNVSPDYRQKYADAMKSNVVWYGPEKASSQVGQGWWQYLSAAEGANSLADLVDREALAMAQMDIEWAEIMGQPEKKPLIVRI
jgi:hypothetical protein